MLESLAPVEKAALFVVSLGRFIGPEVLARLEPGELELLRMGLGNLGPASPNDIEFLHREFYNGYQAADSMRLPVFAFLRRFLGGIFDEGTADEILCDISVDMRSMARTLDFEHDQKFLFEFIRELEEARDRIFPPALMTGPACESPLLRPAVRVVHRWPDLSAKILQSWLSGDEIFRPRGRAGELSGQHRLALFLRTLGPEPAARLVGSLSRERLRALAFEILCAEELAPEEHQAVLVQATEALLHRQLIPGEHEHRVREVTRLLSFPGWLCDLLRDLIGAGTIDPARLRLPGLLPREATMRRELARACSRATRRCPGEVFVAVADSFLSVEGEINHSENDYQSNR